VERTASRFWVVIQQSHVRDGTSCGCVNDGRRARSTLLMLTWRRCFSRFALPPGVVSTEQRPPALAIPIVSKFKFLFHRLMHSRYLFWTYCSKHIGTGRTVSETHTKKACFPLASRFGHVTEVAEVKCHHRWRPGRPVHLVMTPLLPAPPFPQRQPTLTQKLIFYHLNTSKAPTRYAQQPHPSSRDEQDRL
jgi:hypothetical protein